MPWDPYYLNNLHVAAPQGPDYLFAGGSGWGNSGGQSYASIDPRGDQWDQTSGIADRLRMLQMLQPSPIGFQQGGFSSMGGMPSPRGGTTGAMDALSTGGEQQKLPQDPRVMAMLPQLMRSLNAGPAQPGYARIGDDIFQGREKVDLAGTTPQDWMAQHPTTAPVAVSLTPDQRMARARALAASTGWPGEQQNQAVLHMIGQDPLSYDKQQHDWMQQAKTFQDAHRKAQLDEYQTWAKSAEGDPEDILSTFGKNPQLPSAYYRPGRNLAPDPLNPSEVRQIPGGWTNVSGATVNQLQRLRQSLGLNDEAANASLAARMHELLAKAASDGGSQLAGFNQPTDYGAESAQYAQDSLPAGVRHRQAIAGAFSNLPARMDNYSKAIAAGASEPSMLDYLHQLFGGNGNFPRTPGSSLEFPSPLPYPTR